MKRHADVASAAHVSVVQQGPATSKHNLMPPLLGAVFYGGDKVSTG